MATVKSKLKEQLQQEKEKAIHSFMEAKNPNEYEIARKWVNSIEAIERVCKDRKRY